MATVANVWTERAAKARQGGPQSPPQLPPPPNHDAFVVRKHVVDVWPTVTSANGLSQPPKSRKTTPPISPSTFSSVLPTPAFSSPSNSGAVSPAKGSASSSASSSVQSSGPSMPPTKIKQRKWVPIPPEELRAAARQQQRATTAELRNGMAERPGRRKSQTPSTTTSREESVASFDRDRDQQRGYPQPEYAPGDNSWAYINPNATRTYPTSSYFQQPYQYWSTNPPLTRHLQDESTELPPHNHYRDGWRPHYWWLPSEQSQALSAPSEPPPPQIVEPTQQPHPPHPTKNVPPRVFLFGTIDATENTGLDVDAPTKTEAKRRKPQTSPQPESPSAIRISSSPSGPVELNSDPPHAAASNGISPPSNSSSTPVGLPLSASKPALFAIGVSPRARAARLEEFPGVEVVDLTVALGTGAANGQESAMGGKWEFGTTRSNLAEEPTQSPHGTYGPPFWGYPYDTAMYGYAMPPPRMMIPYSPSNDVDPTVPVSHGSEWEVRDFGYGFGHSTTSNADLVRASVLRQPRDYEPSSAGQSPAEERSTARDFERPTTRDFEGQGYGRPRRGSYANGGFEPRGYGGRRGRGGHRGYRGYNSNRADSSAPYGPNRHQQQLYAAFTANPTVNYLPPVPLDDYYGSQNLHMMSEYYSAPPPTLRTQLSFPIDRLRMEILSQLEFYLSPDNMATDFYLRQQMDSRGWVRIDTLASFKRVQAKTTDVNLVRDVLALSHYAETRGDWVRSTEGWEKFVLPTAAPSVVVEEEDDDDEEDEDVVIVMDRI